MRRAGGGGAEELTGLGGLRSSPFPSAAGSGGDARALTFIGGRAFRRRAGASAESAQHGARAGAGSAGGRMGRSSRLLAARSPGGKGRAHPDGAEVAMQGGGRMGEGARATGGG